MAKLFRSLLGASSEHVGVSGGLKMRAMKAARWLLDVFGSSTSLFWRLRELLKSRSIGPVGVWRPRPLQNSSSGGVGAAILETFITFEASQMATTPIGVPAPDLIVGGPGAAESYLRSKVPKTEVAKIPKYLRS